MVADEAFELADDLGVTAEREIGFEAQLERSQPQLLEPADLVAGERLVLELRKGWAAPQPERLPQQVAGLLGGALAEALAAPLEQAVEPRQVERARLDAEQIPGQARLEHALVEQLAQLRDVDLHGLDRGRRRLLAPEVVDEPRGRHQLVRVQQQHGEHRPLLRPTQRQLTALAADRERPQDPEFHVANVTPEPENTALAEPRSS